jgi:hypothetical protein
MTKHTTVLAGLLRHLSGSDFGKTVKKHQADKGVRTLSTFDWNAWSIPRSLIRKIYYYRIVVKQSRTKGPPDRGMNQEPACAGESIINFLSNEDTQELAPGYLHFFKTMVYGQMSECCGLKSEASRRWKTHFWPIVQN